MFPSFGLSGPTHLNLEYVFFFFLALTNICENGSFKLFLKHLFFPARCAVISGLTGGFTGNFECNGMDGRYVNIVIPGRTDYLLLCEVEVYGSRLD